MKVPDEIFVSIDRQWAKNRTPICTEKYVRAEPHKVFAQWECPNGHYLLTALSPLRRPTAGCEHCGSVEWIRAPQKDVHPTREQDDIVERGREAVGETEDIIKSMLPRQVFAVPSSLLTEALDEIERWRENHATVVEAYNKACNAAEELEEDLARLRTSPVATEGKSATENAIDDIAWLLGCPEWEYAGQVVRDVVNAVGLPTDVLKDRPSLHGPGSPCPALSHWPAPEGERVEGVVGANFRRPREWTVVGGTLEQWEALQGRHDLLCVLIVFPEPAAPAETENEE